MAIIYIDLIILISGHITIIYLLPICISNISVTNNVIEHAQRSINLNSICE